MNTANPMTFPELLKRFPDEASCKVFLAKKRWPDGVVNCPRCGEKAYTLKARPFHYLCKSGKESAMPETGKVVTCHKKNGYRFSVITRTVFENTNYPLMTWFRVIFFMFHNKKGMSAHQIHRMLGTGAYETAWYICHRIRASMKDDDFQKLIGEVETDETYVGGKDKNRHWSKKTHKTGGEASGKVPVIGAISRKGNVVCRAIENTRRETLNKFVREMVSDEVTLLATDEHPAYGDLKGEYPHEAVQHRDNVYVRGNVHTNSIESFWSLLKRGIIGNFHHVSKEYLPLYLNEFTFRFNNRNESDIFDKIIAGC
jgi:ISXO2-like transposase domain/Transposase zinc-ribbon domain